MSWVTDLWTLRPRLSIVVVGALIIIGLIKLTSLLPGKYYFNFSQLVSSDGSPFIVDPPGVTYQKLCAIIRNNKLADPKFAAEANCHGDLSDNVQPGSYGRANIDAIYRLVIGNDEAMRQAAQAVAKSLTVPPMPANDLRAAFQNSSDTGNTAGLISSYYRDQARTVVTADLQDKFAAAFEKLPQSADAGGTPDGDAPGPQSAQVQAAFIKAVQVTNADVAKPLDTIALAPITTKKIDEIVKFAGSAENVSSEVIAYYADQVGEAYARRLTANLGAQGIDPEKDKQKLDLIVRAEGMLNYLISVVIRLTPVLAVGLLAGLIFGRREITSAALAGGFAALLLVWPVVLLWDHVVNETWQSKRELFYGLYILYVLSFFMVARFAAGVGAMLRGKLPLAQTPEGAAVDKAIGEGNLAYGVGRDLLIALITHALFTYGNALLTLA